MIIPQIPPKLFTEFSEVIYYDEPHKYFVDKKELTSVTTCIGQFHDSFDTEYWSERKGEEYGLTPEEVKFAWDFNKDRAGEIGSVFHDYAENMFLNKVFPYSLQKDRIINKFGFDVVEEYLKFKMQRFDDFYHKVKKAIIPIRTEMVVWDKDFDIGGMVDLLVFNKKSGDFEIWDHKTNKELTRENMFQKYHPPFSDLDDCDFVKYSLQLSAYKYIIEKYCDIKLGQSHIIWYGNKDYNWEVVKTDDMEYAVIEMFQINKDRKLQMENNYYG